MYGIDNNNAEHRRMNRPYIARALILVWYLGEFLHCSHRMHFSCCHTALSGISNRTVGKIVLHSIWYHALFFFGMWVFCLVYGTVWCEDEVQSTNCVRTMGILEDIVWTKSFALACLWSTMYMHKSLYNRTRLSMSTMSYSREQDIKDIARCRYNRGYISNSKNNPKNFIGFSHFFKHGMMPGSNWGKMKPL